MINNNNKEMNLLLQKENKEKNIMKEIAGDYLIKQTIGEGTFSKVKLGINVFTGQKVAIKILDKIKLIEEEGIGRVLREIKISSDLNHPNIIKIFKIFLLEKDKEYCSSCHGIL
jgi:serine/threonine protein kinase